MQHWLKTIGHARRPLPDDWLTGEDALRRLAETGFPRRPRIAVEPLLVVPLLSNAPPVEAIGVAARSMSQQSHIRLRPDQYERAVEAIASIAT